MLFYTDQGTINPLLVNVELHENIAGDQGGGIMTIGSGVNEIHPTLINVSFHGNQANTGGGIYNEEDASSVIVMDLKNVIMWGDSALSSGPEIYNIGASTLVTNSDIQGCGGSGGGWVGACGTDQGGNIDLDPLFVNAVEGDLTLQMSSPAIDAGDQSLLPQDITDLDQDGNTTEIIELDLALNDRVENSDVDMGPYEFFPTDSDNVGFYNPATGIWRIRSGNNWDDSVAYLQWGAAGWLPVVGDWDDDQVDEVGLYEPATKIWRLKGANNWDAPVTYLVWGPDGGGWTPIAGDWDNDGTDEVGFYDPATRIWRLKSANTWDAPVTYLLWGATGWLPVVGDWDNDGTDEVGLYDPATKIWRLKSSNTWDAGVTYLVWGPDGGGWTPVAGDWDGDGVGEVGFYDPATQVWRLRSGNNWDDPVSYLGWGTESWTPLAGDW